jgi:hypothetical protein
MRIVCWLAILLKPFFAVGQTLHLVPVHLDNPASLNSLKFFCSVDYKQSECADDVRTLQRNLVRYRPAQLGDWSFALETTHEWTELVKRLGGPPESPALTILTRKLTLIDRSLFFATANRYAQLTRAFGVTGQDLIELAISHELGHAICADLDETHAQQYGRKLREGKRIDCLTVSHDTSDSQGSLR